MPLHIVTQLDWAAIGKYCFTMLTVQDSRPSKAKKALLALSHSRCCYCYCCCCALGQPIMHAELTLSSDCQFQWLNCPLLRRGICTIINGWLTVDIVCLARAQPQQQQQRSSRHSCALAQLRLHLIIVLWYLRHIFPFRFLSAGIVPCKKKPNDASLFASLLPSLWLITFRICLATTLPVPLFLGWVAIIPYLFLFDFLLFVFLLSSSFLFLQSWKGP